MTSYSWLQMIRVLAGQEPGHPDIPNTEPCLEIQPKPICDLLVAGCAEITGLPISGGRRETIPPLQWNDIHIGLTTKSAFTNGRHGFGIIARLAGDDGWYDLETTGTELAKLKAVAARLINPLLGPEEILTLAEASLFIAVRTESNPFDARKWLLSQIHEGKLDRLYATPITDWQERSLPLDSYNGAAPDEPMPRPVHWRFRRDRLLVAISNHPSQALWPTRIPPASEWPWIVYDLAQAIVGKASGYTPDRARAWLLARSASTGPRSRQPALRTRFEPRALATLEKRSVRETYRAADPAKIFDDFGEDTSNVGNRPGCCGWFRPLHVLLAESRTDNGLLLEQVEWHGGELQALLELEFSAGADRRGWYSEGKPVLPMHGKMHGAELGAVLVPLEAAAQRGPETSSHTIARTDQGVTTGARAMTPAKTGDTPPEASAPRIPFAAALDKGYQEFVRAWDKVRPPTDNEVAEALKTAFPGNNVPRERRRELKRKFGLDSWRRVGRPKAADNLAEN